MPHTANILTPSAKPDFNLLKFAPRIPLAFKVCFAMVPIAVSMACHVCLAFSVVTSVWVMDLSIVLRVYIDGRDMFQFGINI